MSKTHPVIKETGKVKRFLSEKYVRASVVDLTELVAAVGKMQGASPSSAVALGRILVGTTLLASHTKDDHEIAVQVQCDGPLQSLFCHAGFNGNLRGTVGEKDAPMSLVEGRFSLKPLVKSGTMTVTNYIPKNKNPRRSQIQLVSGEIGEDLIHYLHQSMQIKSLLSLGVKIDGDGKVSAAGGVLVELMPGCTEETLSGIEFAHSKAQVLSELVEKQRPMEEWLHNHVGSLQMAELSEQELRYGCTCEREKARSSIELLGLEEIKELVAAQETLSVNCDMCGLVYKLTSEEMSFALKNLSKPPVH